MSDLDRDLRGGRLRCVGKPKDPDDAVRLSDLEQAIQNLSTTAAASGFPLGRGGRGPQGEPGPSGSIGPPGTPGTPASLYQFEIGQVLDTFSIPFLDAASEIVSVDTVLSLFQGRRAVPGTAGTTTIQLELNGVPVAGAVLSWDSVDPAFNLKSVAIALAVTTGDRLSIRLLSAETGAEDVFAEAH